VATHSYYCRRFVVDTALISQEAIESPLILAKTERSEAGASREASLWIGAIRGHPQSAEAAIYVGNNSHSAWEEMTAFVA
jgi:hypothetical protein